MSTDTDTIDGGSTLEDPLVIAEYDSTPPISLSDEAREYLRDEINGGVDRPGDRIDVEFTPGGEAVLTATSYVGLVALPNGPTLEIRPKLPATNLLYLLQYATSVSARTFDHDTSLQAGTVFVDVLATLYERELQRIRRRGLHTDYVTRHSTEQRLRGRLDIQRQLQRQPPVPSEFECTYEELTPDTPVNQAILRVTEALLRMVSSDDLSSALQRHVHALRRTVSRSHVTHADIASVELTRLNSYYEQILQLTELFLRNSHLGDISVGSRSAFSLLVNMNAVFESVVTQAAENAVADRAGWELTRQDSSKRLVHDGRFNVTLTPDFTVRDPSDTVRLIGDAKWKEGTPANADFYQMTAYQQAHAAPSLLVFPSQGGAITDSCTIVNGHSLSLVELPTGEAYASFAAFHDTVTDAMGTAIEDSLG